MHTFVRPRTVNRIQLLALATALLTTGGLRAQTKKEPESPTPTPLEAKVGGATLRYLPVDITPRRRNARSEAALLKKAKAELSTKEILTYRRKELPPGDYRLAIEQSDSKSWALLIWPAAAKDVKKSVDAADPEEDVGEEKAVDREPALRVPLSVANVPSEDHRVVFELKPLEKGKRVQIIVRAGGTWLRGALRRAVAG